MYVGPFFEVLFSPEGLKVVFENDAQVRNIVDTCMNKGGNLINLFTTDDLANTLNSFTQYSYRLNEINKNLTTIDGSYTVKQAKEHFEKLRTNIVLDPSTDSNSPAVVVDQMNRYSDYSHPLTLQSSCSQVVYDKWVDNKTDCNSTYLQIDSSDATRNLPSNTCLDFSEWDDAKTRSRYAQRPNSCDGFVFVDILSNYVTTLNTYSNQAATILQDLQTDLNK